ncbi:gluconolactonase [Croceivirga lutea]|uniref:SMP-30/gluconolactonase/LRE family protein n=1 Tax=Croceivirga lutea TaxID=1775167 RepID=UPI00163989BC|nr:SMP-30/gluconolactonase/LRE family protein [Croceivirga lutea]GGG48939.1 gluconolactonase [Croceivirga lutea]
MNKLSLFLFTSLLFGYSFAQDNSGLLAEDAELQEITQDFKFTEGPIADPFGNVYFTDQPNNRILKWNALTNEVSTYLEPSGRANGLFFDKQGNLYACADEKFELWKIAPSKEITILESNYKDQKFNGPNDLWIDNKGGIYFTDPYYQRPYWKRQTGEIDGQHLYYRTPNGELLKVEDSFVQPNGLIGTFDGKKLYVADIGDKKTYRFTINADGSLSNKTLFTEMGSDGMTIDNKGNIYLTNENGVTVFNSNGKEILNIPIPKNWTANVTFGGKYNRTLFITAMDAVYTLKMNVNGGNSVE